jgi:hypothetical protein
VVSVKAVTTVSNVVPVFSVFAAPGTGVTFPTVNPAAVIVALAVALSVPGSYCWLRSFSILLLTSIIGHITLPSLLEQPMYQLRV